MSHRDEVEGQQDRRLDGTERLCRAVYGRPSRARDYLGGSEARVLFDAADLIGRLRAEVEQLRGGTRSAGPGAELPPMPSIADQPAFSAFLDQAVAAGHATPEFADAIRARIADTLALAALLLRVATGDSSGPPEVPHSSTAAEQLQAAADEFARMIEVTHRVVVNSRDTSRLLGDTLQLHLQPSVGRQVGPLRPVH